MADEILSQDEISALLGHVDEGDEKEAAPEASAQPSESGQPDDVEGAAREQAQEAATEGPAQAPSPRPQARTGNIFPMQAPLGIDGDLNKALDLVLLAFTEQGSSALSSSLRADITLESKSVEKVPYRDLMARFSEPASIWTLRLDPMGHKALLGFEARLVHSIVDLLMGGDGTAPDEDRSITDLDQAAIESIVQYLSKQFHEAWKRKLAFEVKIEGHEIRPSLVKIYPKGENILEIQMILRIGATEGRFFWGIPCSLLDALEEEEDGGPRGESRDGGGDASALLRELVLEASTVLEAEITGSFVPVADLLSLSPGEVLRLERSTDAPVEVTVNGCRKFSGEVVISQGRRSIKVIEASASR